MGRAAVGQDDRLEEGGPAEAVDVVDVDVGLVQQVAHDLDVPALGGRDDRDAAEAVRERRVGAGLVRDPQDVEQPFRAGVQEQTEK